MTCPECFSSYVERFHKAGCCNLIECQDCWHKFADLSLDGPQ